MSRILQAFSPRANVRHLFVRPPGQISVLDGLRALSILLVIALHAFALYVTLEPEAAIELVNSSDWRTHWGWNGEKGVDIFFVISGFLITQLLLQDWNRHDRLRLGRFYWRRFLRLAPAYWVILALYAALQLPNANNIWANLLYVNNFLPYEQQAMNWSWSLAIEEQFYLLYPLLLWSLLRFSQQPERWFWGLLVLSFLIRAVIVLTDPLLSTHPGSAIVKQHAFHAHHFSVLYDNLYTRYGSLLCGCIAAWYFSVHSARLAQLLQSRPGLLVTVMAIAVVIAGLWVPILSESWDEPLALSLTWQIGHRTIFSGGIAWLILVALHPGVIGRMLTAVLGARCWYPIAQLSYSMYLVHVIPIVLLVQQAHWLVNQQPDRFPSTPYAGMLLLLVVSAIISMMLALVLYLVVERPWMNLRK